MDKVFLQVAVALFSGVIAFMVANTAVSYMFPIFDDIGTGNTMLSGAIPYTETSNIIKGAFFISIFIVLVIPIAFLFMRIIRKEEEPERQAPPAFFPGG